jgi:hypothetical protein
MSVEYVRQRTPAEEKADAVARLEAAARNGEGPETFKREDVLWALGGDQAAVDRLAATAAAARDERARALREQKQREELRAATHRILEQWDAAEKAERYARAETLAREELGL